MQALLQKQVDLEQRDRFAVIPVYPDDAGRSLAHAVLDELGKQPAYRQAMDKWLAENSALTQEDLLKGWFRHYHTVIRSEIFDFLAPDDLALLWKIMGKNALYALNRSECQGLSAQQLGDVINQERVKLIAQNKKRIAAVFALAVGQELQREQQPESGGRRPPKVSQALVMHSFQKMKALWPQRDQEILHEAFSYKQNPVQRSAAEECDRNWLVSHAIADSASQRYPVSARKRNDVEIFVILRYFRRAVRHVASDACRLCAGQGIGALPRIAAQERCPGKDDCPGHGQPGRRCDRCAGHRRLAIARIHHKRGRPCFLVEDDIPGHDS